MNEYAEAAETEWQRLVDEDRGYLLGDTPESPADPLARIAYAAVSSQWDQPRDLRVLVALVKDYPKGLTRHIGLRALAVDSGLADKGNMTRPCLDRLQDAGWLTWSHSRSENRTTVDLIVPESMSTYPVHQLYEPTSDAFNHEVTGSAGYLLCSFVKASGQYVFTLSELAALTRQATPWVEKTLSRMTTAGLAWYTDKWDLTPMYERLQNDGLYGFTRYKERLNRADAPKPVRGIWWKDQP